MTLFAKTDDGYGYGDGIGNGSGSGFGFGFGSGSGFGSGHGYGHGNSSGFGSGHGNGEGDGFGDGIFITSVDEYDVMIDEFGFGVVRVGCQVHPFDWWLDNWSEVAKDHRIDVEVAEQAMAEVVKYLGTLAEEK